MMTSPINDLITVRDWIRWGASEFTRANLYFGHGTDNAWDEAMVLVLWALSQPWDHLEQIMDARLTLNERETVANLLIRRIESQQPAAYLTGEAWFGGVRFEVSSDVLVPRSPIAELVLAGFQPWVTEYPQSILDLCTGSGCIGLLCAEMFSEASVDLSDVSPKALAIAKRNIESLGHQDRVNIIESDVFNAEEFVGKTYDLIVSNPPYVDAKDLASMPAEYHAEPALGLASGEDGLNLTRRILRDALLHLNPGGILVVEVGNSWEALEETYPEVDFFWPEFENGGHGIFILTAEQLLEYGSLFTGH
ncbi:50S ribosomal protein L3 N(5)-glutamine methyltransferase [Teredinibacter purpureus]|uniref:50S ribosomal protein L3 N(5)-glutamine methyltransferase n=1 Tax=Teredinibacter purpureus TaxID=2731756 RepID=UPI0005F7C413|nr:50S ribosomal protein L3 N(5)-glutamine methyltransferase [Teredinibacter purpureus]